MAARTALTVPRLHRLLSVDSPHAMRNLQIVKPEVNAEDVIGYSVVDWDHLTALECKLDWPTLELRLRCTSVFQ